MARMRFNPVQTASLALHRDSLPLSTANAIEEQIRDGLWPTFLPGEHDLGRLLNIGRNTVRSALRILEERAVIEVRKGCRTRVLAKRGRQGTRQHRIVHLMTPLEINELGPFMHEWSLRLRQALAAKGVPMEIHTRRQLFLRYSAKALQRYVETHPRGVWLLQVAPLKMQQWFMQTGVPCVLAGSPHPGVTLPYADIHTRAAGRHAAGLLMAAGHRSLGVLTFCERYAGDLQAIEGVRDAIASHPAGSTARVVEIKYSGEPESILHHLGEALETPRPPTALIICQQRSACAVFAAANRLKIRIPEDLSLVCLQTGSFMEYLTPSLAHYWSDPNLYAKKLYQRVWGYLDTAPPATASPWLIPTYRPGQSIAAPR